MLLQYEEIYQLAIKGDICEATGSKQATEKTVRTYRIETAKVFENILSGRLRLEDIVFVVRQNNKEVRFDAGKSLSEQLEANHAIQVFSILNFQNASSQPYKFNKNLRNM